MQSLINNIRNFIILSRPLNVLIVFLSICIAAAISPAFHLNWKLLFAALTAAFITCGANIINDIFDIEIDRINKPLRLLPSGKVSLTAARTYFYLTYLIAFILAFFSGWIMLAIALIFGLLLYSYSAKLKRTILYGNLVVSLATAVAFIYGALAVDDWPSGIIPAVFAFFFHFGREIIKDMQDVEGDLAHQAVTFAGRYGSKRSALLVNIIFALLILLTLLPYILRVYGISYLILVVIGVDLILIAVSALLWVKHDPVTLGRLSHLLKLDMFVGLAAIYLGAQHVIFAY